MDGKKFDGKFYVRKYKIIFLVMNPEGETVAGIHFRTAKAAQEHVDGLNKEMEAAK